MRVQISASEAFTKRKISRFFVVFVSTSVTLKTNTITFLNYTLVSSGNHIQNIQITDGNPVSAHTGDFTMATAEGPTRAVPGVNNITTEEYGHLSAEQLMSNV